MPASGSWRDMAANKLQRMRDDIREECWPDHHWPIWIHGAQLGFPGDDVAMPRGQPANDRLFTFSR